MLRPTTMIYYTIYYIEESRLPRASVCLGPIEEGQYKDGFKEDGTQFTSPIWNDRLAREGIRVMFASVRHLQSNPTERVMRELGRLFRTLSFEAHASCAKHIPRRESFLNVTTHSSTVLTPHELHFGARADDRIATLISFPEGEEMTHSEKIARAGISMMLQFEKRIEKRKKVFPLLVCRREIWCCFKCHFNLTLRFGLLLSFFTCSRNPAGLVKSLVKMFFYWLILKIQPL